MATGDLRGNLERLRMQLLSINYPHPFDVQGLKQGIPAVVLPLLHYALLGYSRHVARYLSARGYELYAKSDLRFMESALRFFREEFNYRCALTIAQMSKRKHTELVKLGRDKTIEKAELTQINYDTMSGCGPGISNLKHPRACEVQSMDHLPVRKMKPWEHTLRTSKNSVRCSKDPGCAHVDITVLPGSEPISPRHRRTDSFVEHHQSTMPIPKGSNTWESPIGTHAKSSSTKVKKRVTYQEDLADVPTRGSNEFSAEDQSHQEICQKIMDMAEKLEARFSTLEAGVTRAKETLQEKLVSLEGRVRNLENVKQEQNLASFRDPSRGNCKEHSTACTTGTGDLSQRKNVAYAASCTTGEEKEHDAKELCEAPTSKTVDMLRPKCNEHAWSLHQNFQDSHHFEPVTGVPASQPLNSQAIRDISNTHQCVVKNLTNHAVGTSRVKVFQGEYKSVNQQEPVTSTRDFIAGVRARFNRTLELLSQEAKIINSAAHSC